MERQILGLLLLCFWSKEHVTAWGTLDPCLPGNHDVIRNVTHRSTLYTVQPTDPYICDVSMAAGWYVFEGNKEIPTSCVQQFHCGTHAPIWMRGGNPSVHDGIVTREGCINFGIANPQSKCCNMIHNMKVKNCGTFMVYHLVKTPSCAIAYCAGSERVCEVPGGNGSCADKYPKLLKFPELGKPEVTQSNMVRFPCKVPYQTGVKDVAFKVTWTVNGKVLVDSVTKTPISTDLTGDSRVAYLDASKLQGNLGKDLRCNVSSYHPSRPNDKSEPIESNPYWVGIRVSKSHITVDESGKEQELALESTLPIVCNAMNQNECKLTVEIHQSKNPNDLSWSSCAVDLKPDPVTGTYKGTVKVKATRDFINDHNIVHQISFDPVTDFFHPTFVGYKVSSVHIQTINKDHGHCVAHGDPHFQGFDYKRNYNIYEVGDMVLYRSKNQKRPFEVQVRTWGCGKYHPCICAVIAREGNDVVELDMCEKRMNRVAAPTFKVLSGQPLEGTTLWRDKSGKNFYINFASGARIAIKAYVLRPRGTHEKDGMLNVDVQAPTDDLKSAEGLCGNWEGHSSGRFHGGNGRIYNSHEISKFSSSWVLHNSQSLFYNLPKYDPSLKPNRQYCACKKNTVDCTKGNGANNPSKNVCSGKCVKPKLHTANFVVHGRRRARMLEPRSIVLRSATFPTPNGLTEAKAREMCLGSMKQSTLFGKCKDTLSNRTAEFVDACVEDMKFADGDLFTITHMDAFDSACQNEVLKDVNNINYTADGDLILPPDVTSAVCPNQCSLRGSCQSGKCICLAGYTSEDCSVKVGEPPAIDFVRDEGVCDQTKGVCNQVHIIAENLVDADTLTCNITKVRNDADTLTCNITKIVPTTNGSSLHVTIKAEFVNFMEVMCPVPQNLIVPDSPYQEFNISVSVDGSTFSSAIPYVIFDSRCVQCDDAQHCQQEKGNNSHCIINGHCYKRGEQNSAHEVCDPSISDTKWSSVPDVKETDYFTALFTGCACPYDKTRFYCACCQNSGCQCGISQPNQCSSCDRKDLCGKFPELFPAPP